MYIYIYMYIYRIWYNIESCAMYHQNSDPCLVLKPKHGASFRPLRFSMNAMRVAWHIGSWERWASLFLNCLSLVSSFSFCFLSETSFASIYCAKHLDMNWLKREPFRCRRQREVSTLHTMTRLGRFHWFSIVYSYAFLFLPVACPFWQNDTCQAFCSQVSG